MGQMVGASTARGERPKDRPFTPTNILSTVYHVLGIDPARTFPDGGGRPVHILDEREPVKELIWHPSLGAPETNPALPPSVPTSGTISSPS